MRGVMYDEQVAALFNMHERTGSCICRLAVTELVCPLSWQVSGHTGGGSGGIRRGCGHALA